MVSQKRRVIGLSDQKFKYSERNLVEWRIVVLQDACPAGCISGRALHLHVPVLVRISMCQIHHGRYGKTLLVAPIMSGSHWTFFLDYSGEVEEALKTIEEAIILDFNNPVSLSCICRARGSFWSTLRATVFPKWVYCHSAGNRPTDDCRRPIDARQTPERQPTDHRQ